MWNKFIIKIKKILYPIYAYKEWLFKIYIEKKTAPKFTNKNFKIPLIVYQMWINNVFPKTLGKQIKNFRNLNPDVEFILMSHNEVNQYMLEFYKDHQIYKIFQKAKYYQIKADIFRYCILHERGGIWFDIKSSLKIPITQLFNCNSEAIISYEKNDINFNKNNNFKSSRIFQYPNKKILIWGLAFCKKNVILKNIIEAICLNYKNFKNKIFLNPKNAILDFTGTHLFTKIVKQEMMRNNFMKIQQLGIDFNSYGEYQMKGSSLRYYMRPDYSNDKNQIIIN